MTAIAWAHGFSDIQCEDGSRGGKCGSDPDRWNWNSSMTSRTHDTSNTRFFVQGKLVAVEGDSMEPHPDGSPCTTSAIDHAPTTSLHAGNFYISGKKAVRIGSKFNNDTPFDHTVTTGCDIFIVGGPNG